MCWFCCNLVSCEFQVRSSMESPLRCPLPPGGRSSPREEEEEEGEDAEVCCLEMSLAAR